MSEAWDVSLIASLYYTKDRLDWINNQEFEQDIWALYSQLKNSFSLLRDRSLTIDVNLYYITENIQGLRRVEPLLLSFVDIKKTILKGRGSITLGVEDLFNEADFLVTTRFLDQNSSNFSNFDNRLVKFGFRYSFGNTKLSSTESDFEFDERKRLTNDN